jgi:hypothetical protein
MNKWIALTSIVLYVLLRGGAVAQTKPAGVLSRVDHLVYATGDLKAGVDRIEQLLGVRAVAGGPHPGGGTRNALVALGPTTYLEIVGRDPDQPEPKQPRPFGIDHLTEPKLVAWVANGRALEQLVQQATRDGIKLGEVIPGSRQRPDGVLLAWRYTNPETVEADRLVPYFIDWGTSPHPARTAARGASLVDLRAEHPDAPRVEHMLRQIGLALPVRTGPKPSVIATIDGLKGRVELRY